MKNVTQEYAALLTEIIPALVELTRPAIEETWDRIGPDAWPIIEQSAESQEEEYYSAMEMTLEHIPSLGDDDDRAASELIQEVINRFGFRVVCAALAAHVPLSA